MYIKTHFGLCVALTESVPAPVIVHEEPDVPTVQM